MDATDKKYCVAVTRNDFLGIKKNNIYEYSCDYDGYDTYYIVYTRQKYNWFGHESMFEKSFEKML